MFDAIVIGSGMSGGIAAKELCERGLKVLVIERGRMIKHGEDYMDTQMPWELPNNNKIPEDELARDYAIQSQCYAVNAATKQFWVKDSEHPYTTPEGKPFAWIRGYHLGGRSIMWGRQSYRLSPQDFEANAKDGHGCDWPIRYDDLAPWYDHIEKFIGVAGSKEGLPQLPDGEFLPAFEMNDGEKLFKASVEAKFPGRKVIIGRNANLSVAQPHHEELGRSSLPEPLDLRARLQLRREPYQPVVLAARCGAHRQSDHRHRCHRPQPGAGPDDGQDHRRARDRCQDQARPDL